MITKERLDELLCFDLEAGIVTNKTQRSSRTNIGAKAGWIDKTTGYRRALIDGENHRVSRLIWLHVHGVLPKYIDHINHDRLDNRLVNLREVTPTENNRNRSLPTTNTSGIVGVYWNKKGNMWQASISINCKNKHLGWFKLKEDAVITRKAAEIECGYHKNHGINWGLQ